MRIAVDAMGGEHAPAEVVRGAVEAARKYGVEIALVGRGDRIQPHLLKYRLKDANLSIIEASQVIENHESPTRAVRRKPDSSIVVGMNLLKRGLASAFVSAGHTGAMVAAALLILGKEEGIERPALGVLFGTSSGTALLLDVGANADCRPSFLIQFARMGSAYMERVQGISRPRIGLLSSGEEESRGNRLVRESHRLLKLSGLNFVGNVEGKDIPKGLADVIVTDGFTGNVVLKTGEGMGEALVHSLKQATDRGLLLKLAGLLLRPALRASVRWLDYTEYGGAPLLGVKGIVIVSHGRSQAKAIRNAIGLAKQAVEKEMLEEQSTPSSGSIEGESHGTANRSR